MKVLVACSVVPFADSPTQARARALCRQLTAAGHESEILRIPFATDPPTHLPAQLAMMRGLESWNADHLVALDLAASLLRHPRKSLWLDDGLPLADGGDTSLAALLANAAQEAAAESRAAFCVSNDVRDQMLARLQIALPVLLVPPRRVVATQGEFLFSAPPRMKADTRVLAALAQTAPEVQLLVAGAPAFAGQQAALLDAAAALGVAQQVRFDLRSLAESEIDAYLAAAVAVVCIGGTDDAGLAIAAAGAGKALIAAPCSDSHRPLVRPYLTGWQSMPGADGLAAAFGEAWTLRHRSLAYGAQARDLLYLSGINWPQTLEKLLS
jgi:hypothetical protein